MLNLRSPFRIPYWYVLAIPFFLVYLGAFCNQLVLIANHGEFPVMVNPVQQTELGDGATKFLGDSTHVVMTPQSRLKALGDVFNEGDGIASLGDLLIKIGDWLWSYATTVWVVLVIIKYNSLTLSG